MGKVKSKLVLLGASVVLIILIVSGLIFKKNLNAKYYLISQEHTESGMAGEVFTHLSYFKKLPDSNKDLIEQIQKSMKVAGTPDYLNSKLDPFSKKKMTYYYLPIKDHNLRISGFVILSSGIDGIIQNKNIVSLNELKLYEERPTFWSYFNGEKDILVSYYRYDSSNNLDFVKFENDWYLKP